MAAQAYSINKTKFLSDEEYKYLENILYRSKAEHPRDALLLETLMYTGARISEILATTKNDLHRESETIFIKGLKNSRDREIPLPAWLFKQLELLTDLSQPPEKIFPIAIRTAQSIWHHYRPAKKGIKSLRHTFAIRLYQKTKDIRLVQMALGHKSILNTMVYADYIYNQEELRKLLL